MHEEEEKEIEDVEMEIEDKSLSEKGQQLDKIDLYEESKEETKPKVKTYLERCKEVGRIGPSKTKLDMESVFGSFKEYGSEGLEVEAINSFSSIRANTAVFSGKFYYEVKLSTSGLM